MDSSNVETIENVLNLNKLTLVRILNIGDFDRLRSGRSLSL